MLKLNIDFFSF